jgi:hypothetical protein
VKIPEYYANFYLIAKELLKPISKKFSLEICYLFNKVIELSEELKDK